MTYYGDLRSYIDALDAMGDIMHVTREVDGDFEPSAITRRSYEIQSPAPLFHNVAGVAPGFRLFGAPASLSSRQDMPYARVAMSLGLAPDCTGPQIVEALSAARHKPGIPPVRVASSDALCHQNILRGEDANLDRFPIPFAHDKDGGRYANTWGTLIVKTPDGKWVNWSIARVMKVDGKRMVGLIVPSQHIGQIWTEWVKLGQPMPYALVQGPAPAISCVSGIPIPAHADEADYIGTLAGEPVPVVKAISIDLDVPATAEIVIEGHVSINRDCQEGPYGEYGGYLGEGSSAQPTFHVETITHRDDPIWPMSITGRPTDESHTLWAMGLAADALTSLREAELPIVTAWIPEDSTVHWLLVVVPQNWRELLPGVTSEALAQRIGEVLFKTDAMVFIPKVYVVDDDFDPTNLREVVWVLSTRVHPVGRRVVFDDQRVIRLPQCYEEEEYVAGRGAKVVFDTLQTTRHLHASFEQGYPEEVRQRVLDNWPTDR
ncbi:UbiD family decarboxylase [Leclercia adecarboxylata]|uniref:Pyrrole-2-carboxylic acid decarboxylase n=1 Tax=Leclercia adecarboxylata TaxID=83655 RepID=A0A9X3Y7Y5_9ENTR|nr:UbiD family decarboxylase [Leclercia adecarboxylata]MBD1405421.1 UbiD family decarboxylase [Leclercia adecarboxylata]MDC6621389.1 UbiD family decarboxylase [Leclercia adecarboxylata]MDC6632381.1 UbiD family decarboxylase [Leclercia adecarboxylata]MDC6637336.1 UbiD family decarboxylase [Leclercia adecarboxylata]MDC6648296.1 UbiD family decarboxylase [Leclercia adecarboxylata]